MLAEAQYRRAACTRGSPHHTLRVTGSHRQWIIPSVHLPLSSSHATRCRGNFTVAGVGAHERGVFPVGNSSEDALELAATKKNLREAREKIDMLTQQVVIVGELQVQMAEQDELIAELEQLIESDKRKQDEEREVLNAKVLEAQNLLAVTIAELEEARRRLSALPGMEQLQAEVARLRDVESKLEAAQAQAARVSELDALQEQQSLLQEQLQEQLLEQQNLLQAQLQEQLQEQRDSRAEVVQDLETAKQQLAAAQEEAAAARQEAQEAQEALSRKVEEMAAVEADVEAMRKTMNKGNKKGRVQKGPPTRIGGGKGFASPAAPALPAARLEAGAENHLRQELKQAQTELEQLQGTLDEREAQLQAAQSAVEFLTSQCKEQELQLMALETRLDETRAQVQSQKKVEEDLQQQAAALTVRLRAEANDKASAVAALAQQLESASCERAALAAERDSLCSEVAGLRECVQQLEEQRGQQDVALGELDMSLQELRLEVDTAQQLKMDLAILAEAFSAKEMELEMAQDHLVTAEGREQELQAQVAQAEESLRSLTVMLGELQSTNTELGERFLALDASLRSTSEQRAEAEAWVANSGRQLVEAREQLAGLWEQLAAKDKDLMETAQSLSEARAAESSQRTAAQTLSERLAAEQAAVIKQTRDVETLREQVVVLNEQIAFWSGTESSVKKLQEALLRSDGELADLREQLTDAQRQVEKAGSSADAWSKERERLQRELAVATSTLGERESALALARRAAEATDTELRAAKRQSEAAATEVANMRAQVSALVAELAAVRQERSAASRAGFESLRQLQSELAAEAVATLDLLNKAESLVMTSSEQVSVTTAMDVNTLLQHARNDLDVQTELWEAERQRSACLEREVAGLSEQLRNAALGKRLPDGDDASAAAGGMAGTLASAFLSARDGGGRSPSPGVMRDMEVANVKLLEELNTTRDSVLSARSETEALQTRVQFLEREIRSRDALITDLRSSGVGRSGRPSDALVQQLKSLQEENTKLKQSAARQQQLLNQTKRFFEKKIGPNVDLSVTVGTTLHSASSGVGRGGGGASPGRGVE